MGEVSKPARRAVRYQLKYRGNECLNCGHPLEMSDRYCPNCSQLNSTKNITLRDFIEEFLGSIIDYDSRLLQTVKALILRPGQITLDYVAGKRVTYTNPFRFLLSLAIIYFLLLQTTSDFRSLDREPLDVQLDQAPAIPKIVPPVSEADKQMALQVLDSMQLGGEMKVAREAIQSLDSIPLGDQIMKAKHDKDSAMLADPKGYLEKVEGGSFGRFASKTEAFITLIRKDTLFEYQEAMTHYGLPDTRENRISFSTAQSLLRLMRQPGSFINEQISKLPLVIFFFLPVFSIFLWLVYIRKSYTYTDNLVFSFQIQSLFFILLIIGALAGRLVGKDFTWLSFAVFSVYLYAAMRKFYKQGHFKTILKYLFLNTIFVILAWIAIIVLFVGSAVTY